MVLEKLLLAGWDMDNRAVPGTKRRLSAGDGSSGPPGPQGTQLSSYASSGMQEGSAPTRPPALLATPSRAPPYGWAPDPAVLDPRGVTALLVAAAGHERHACVSWLLASGARRDAADGRGATPLMVAAAAGQWDAFGVLLPLDQEGRVDGSHGELAVADSMGRSLLHAAAFGGCRRILRLLLDAGIDPAAAPTSEDGRSCLHHAAAGAGGRASFGLLLDAGCCPDLADAGGSLPWHLAAEKVPGFLASVDACMQHMHCWLRSRVPWFLVMPL